MKQRRVINKRMKNLESNIKEIDPDASFINYQTTVDGKRGYMNGYELSNGTRVGVFKRQGSNVGKTVVRNLKDDDSEQVKKVVKALSDDGFPMF